MKNEIILSLIILLVISSIAEASNYSDFKKVLRNSLIDFFEKTSSGNDPVMTPDEIRDMIDFFTKIPEKDYNMDLSLVGENSGNTIMNLYEKAKEIETQYYAVGHEVGWCGDLFCNAVMGENATTCCTDCGCSLGYICFLGNCVNSSLKKNGAICYSDSECMSGSCDYDIFTDNRDEGNINTTIIAKYCHSYSTKC